MSQSTTPAKPASDSAANFDFDTVFGPVADKLDFGMDMCGVDPHALLGKKTQAMMPIAARATLQVYYETESLVTNGFNAMDNAQRLRSPQEARDAMVQAAYDHASSDPVWTRLHHEATENPMLPFGLNKHRIELGGVGKAYYAFSTCTGCAGKGQTRCCLTGGTRCTKCNGHGRYSEVSHSYGGSKVLTFNCGYCGCSGTVPCIRCGGRCWIDCGACAATGGYTTAYFGKVYGLVENGFTYTGSKYAEEAAAFLERPGPTVLSNSFMTRPAWDLSQRPFVGTLSLKVPVQRVAAETTHLDRTHSFTLSFAGTDLHWVLRHPFVDPMIEPYLQRIERSAGTAAYTLANETALGGALVKSVLAGDTAPAVVVDVCNGVISTVSVERIIRALGREATRLTRGPVQRAWIEANVAAIGLWALVAAVFGASLRQALPPSVTGEAYLHLSLAWCAFVPALIAAGFVWSRRAARRSLSAILKEPVQRAPELGGPAVFGSLALVAIVTLAMVGFAPSRPGTSQVAGTGMERTR